MKKFCILLTALFLGLSAGAQTPFQITFGPYLQNVTADGATVIWGTSADALSWVEAAPDGEDHFYAEERPQYYQTKLGKRTVGRLHTVRITGLKPASFYRYRVCSREVTELQPYKVSYGQTICSDVYRKKPYRFKTRDAAQQSVSFTVVNDIHENSDMLATLLSDVKKEQRDFVFFNGDMVNNMSSEQQLIDGFLRRSTELFAAEIPFLFARGNHETRGNMAREYARYVPKSSGKYYGAYRVGDIMFVVLDCGEDKPDDFWVYAGLTDFDGYRTEQAAWFGELIRSKAYKSAKWRIVMNHFPPLSHMEGDNPERHGIQDITDKFLPLYNQAKIDLMISGHTHAYEFMSPDKYDRLTFPVIVNSTESVARIDIDGRTLKAKVTDTGGNTLKEFTISK